MGRSDKDYLKLNKVEEPKPEPKPLNYAGVHTGRFSAAAMIVASLAMSTVNPLPRHTGYTPGPNK